jgi:hypothetical protein
MTDQNTTARTMTAECTGFSEATMSSSSTDGMVHLLNCVECDYSGVIVGPSRQADVQREVHEDSIRNWRRDDERCPVGSVVWAFITDKRAKQALDGKLNPQ